MVFAMQQMRYRACHSLAPQAKLEEVEPMDPKLTILFMLIGVIITMSHLADGTFGRVRRQLSIRSWREKMPGSRRI
jgi:hypothetical protein